MVENTVLTEESLELLEQKARYLYQFNPAAAQALRQEIEQKRYRLLRSSFLEPTLQLEELIADPEDSIENPESILKIALSVEEALLEVDTQSHEETPETVTPISQAQMEADSQSEPALVQPSEEEPVALIDQRQPKPLQWDQLSLF